MYMKKSFHRFSHEGAHIIYIDIISGLIVLVLVCVITILLCMRGNRTRVYSTIGFRRLNVDDSDEEDEIFGDLGKPLNAKHSNGIKEYHDYSSDEDEHKLFDAKLART